MKKTIFTLWIALFACSVYAKDIKELVVTTNPPMHCQNCENKIKKGDVRFVKGVKKIETSIPEQKVTIEYDADQTTPEKIEEAFTKIGYTVTVIDPKATETVKVEACENCGNEPNKTTENND